MIIAARLLRAVACQEHTLITNNIASNRNYTSTIHETNNINKQDNLMTNK